VSNELIAQQIVLLLLASHADAEFRDMILIKVYTKG